MSERKYSVAEIDAMRATLRERHLPTRVIYHFMGSRAGEAEYIPPYSELYARAEDELRTYMLGGVEPDELTA